MGKGSTRGTAWERPVERCEAQDEVLHRKLRREGDSDYADLVIPIFMNRQISGEPPKSVSKNHDTSPFLLKILVDAAAL